MKDPYVRDQHPRIFQEEFTLQQSKFSYVSAGDGRADSVRRCDILELHYSILKFRNFKLQIVRTVLVDHTGQQSQFTYI